MSFGQQPEVDHPAAAGGDQLLQHHGLELLAPSNSSVRPSADSTGGDGHRRVERVVGLDRAAAGRVGVEQAVAGLTPGLERHGSPGPVQGDDAAGQVAPLHVSPAGRADQAARPGWSGHAWMDSARYS